MCGEMAADPYAVPLLIGMGLDCLSVSSAVIPGLKQIIRSLNYSELKKLAEECLDFKTEAEVNSHLHNFFEERLQEQSKNLF